MLSWTLANENMLLHYTWLVDIYLPLYYHHPAKELEC